MDLPSEANRAFLLLSPQTCCPPHQPQPLSLTPALLFPPLTAQSEPECAWRPSPGGSSLAGLSNQGLGYLCPQSPKPAETAAKLPESSESPSRALSKGPVPRNFPPTICPGFPVAAPGPCKVGSAFSLALITGNILVAGLSIFIFRISLIKFPTAPSRPGDGECGRQAGGCKLPSFPSWPRAKQKQQNPPPTPPMPRV